MLPSLGNVPLSSGMGRRKERRNLLTIPPVDSSGGRDAVLVVFQVPVLGWGRFAAPVPLTRYLPMKRRQLLRTLAALPTVTVPSLVRSQEGGDGRDLHNPYESIDWEGCRYVHSMSHQHQGQSDQSRDLFYAMGYRHFAFSNYYPSAPTPLPREYAEAHPDLASSPNAEHGTLTDIGLHCNALGSLYGTGYGHSLSARQRQASPLQYRFENLRVFDEAAPWKGVYRLDLRFEAKGGANPAQAMLSIQGATACDLRNGFADQGPVANRSFGAGNHSLYLRTQAPWMDMALHFDPAMLELTQCRLMQGTNRPWRDLFRAALDGETLDGQHEGGLLDSEGGGITLNHPTGPLELYTELLDFDPRVLGIEVWNQLTSGFGSSRGFYQSMDQENLHFYRLWDDLLRTGRRCWGFFVKDHNTYGRGRNVLVLPGWEELPMPQREQAALRAYRQGQFFGSVAALSANEEDEIVAPYDYSDFRFTRLHLRRDGRGTPRALEVAVAGNDPERRPQVQIRVVSDRGIELIADASETEFPLPLLPSGAQELGFVRVEAFAYPRTHQGGQPLTPEILRKLNVQEISLLHDRWVKRGPTFFGTPQELRTPLPIVDLIFSQPLLRV